MGEQAQPVADKVGDRIQGAAKQVAQQAPKVADDASARIERAAETVAKEAPKRAAALSDVLEVRSRAPFQFTMRSSDRSQIFNRTNDGVLRPHPQVRNVPKFGNCTLCQCGRCRLYLAYAFR